jgi:RNA polymerase sigma factor (TIGR02999 family)
MPEDQSGQVTALSHHWRQGGENTLQALVSLVCKELQRLADYQLRAERPEHTLQSTALVHQAYLRWLGGEPVELLNRAHVIAIASRPMRKILGDDSRERNAVRQDGGNGIAFEYLDALPVKGDPELVALNDSLDELLSVDARQGKIVETKFFGGLRSRRSRRPWESPGPLPTASGRRPGSGCIAK